ncbi:unnamed protein product [Sphagnum balticum]
MEGEWNHLLDVALVGFVANAIEDSFAGYGEESLLPVAEEAAATPARSLVVAATRTLLQEILAEQLEELQTQIAVLIFRLFANRNAHNLSAEAPFEGFF